MSEVTSFGSIDQLITYIHLFIKQYYQQVNFLILAIIMRRISRARFGATDLEKKRRLRYGS